MVTGTARHTSSTITSSRTGEVEGGFREEVAPEGVLGSAKGAERSRGRIVALLGLARQSAKERRLNRYLFFPGSGS